MNEDFEVELKGSLIEATAAKDRIVKYFKHYGDTGHHEAKKHQLIFASKITCAISKCENRHPDIYCNIITDIFGDQLDPKSSAKYWSLYLNCLRYIHYLLVEKKNFEKAALIYKHILSYNNKLQNTENGLTCINIYCYHLLLQNSLKSKNQELALCEATDVVENLTKLFNDILDTNTKHNFQYPDILKKAMSWLFPKSKSGTVYQFLKTLPGNKVKQMFQALFTLYGRQTIDIGSNDDEVQEHANVIIQTVYTLLQVDIMDKMQLQLSAELMGHCNADCRLQTNRAIIESFLLFNDYLKLLSAQKLTLDFQRIYCKLCDRFKELFNKYSTRVMNQSWFGDFLVLIFYLHSQLQNVSIFSCFWKQMCKPDCFKSMFKFFIELMKLAPCISAETKLFTLNCCTSTRKHVIISFAQIALASFVFYCQNVSEEDERQANMQNGVDNLIDNYKETIQNNIILIINHAFKIIDKMDCITSKSQEIDIILTRFKQATISCKTNKQAGTCLLICELFLKIKTKIASKEWPLLLRRLYKSFQQVNRDLSHIGRDLQMCYITSLLSQMDINQIRTQISIFYANETTPTNANEQQQQHEHCLLHLYYTTTLLVRPQLTPSHKKILHWLESQHVLKYYKSNTSLLHSILKNSQSHYDFVLITKLAKLQTYAMAKISSLYKSLKSKTKEINVLGRLEQLTFGHVCAILLNDMNSNQKFQVDSKDLTEEQLENLLMRAEMSSITIANDLKRFKLAWEAFKAFENFYDRFDSEPISMDDAIIDWESILDDLGSIALCLQLSGYMEYSSQVWLLHYKCSRLIRDDFSALRGLAYFCEYSEYYEKNTNSCRFNIEQEIQSNYSSIIQGLDNLPHLQRQAYQSYILLAVLQISHYYARSSRFSFAQMLLQYAEQKHAELPERQGRYDIVLATIDAIKFRLLWKHSHDSNVTIEEKATRTMAENLLLHRCLLHEIEETLDRFHDFSYISSCDGVLYSILIINLVQELAECTANRLCDNFINALFIATCKCTLLLGLALRFVQVMSMWLWVNLQMEYVDKAQVKLKLIEYVMGMKSLKELTEKSKKSTKSIRDVQSSSLLPTPCPELLTPNHHNPGMEAIRRLAEVQLSPIKTDKLQLSPSHENSDLKRYFKCNIDQEFVPQNEQIEWTLFMVGCLNARLFFLVENYDQLETFYEKGIKWLQMRHNNFNKKYYKNVQLMAMQHYVNFLRARRRYDKALEYLKHAMDLCENKQFYIDAVYCVNFQLQLIATQKDISGRKNVDFNLPTHSKLRRALQFNVSPDRKHQKDPAEREVKQKMLQNVLCSGKKSSSVIKLFPVYPTDVGCSSTKRNKTQAGVGSSILDIKTTRSKPKFQICEDSLEIVEISDNNDDVIQTEDAKSKKRTKVLDKNERMQKTPKIIGKTPISTTTKCSRSTVKIKRPELVPKFNIDISLSDSPSSSSVKSSSSSIENCEAKENLNTNELEVKMQNLVIASSKATKVSAKDIATKTPKSRRKPKEPESDVIVVEDSSAEIETVGKPKTSRTRAASAIIVLEDSPEQIESVNKPKSSRTRAATKDKSVNGHSANEDILALTSRSRRQRKLVLDNNDKQNELPSTRATPSIARKRQKNLV